MKVIQFLNKDTWDSWEFSDNDRGLLDTQVTDAMFDFEDFRELVDWGTTVIIDDVELSTEDSMKVVDYYNQIFVDVLREAEMGQLHKYSMRYHDKVLH